MCIRRLLRILCKTKKALKIYPNLPKDELLIWAIKHKNLGLIVKCYIDGVEGSLIDEEGNNLLHLAVHTNNLEVVRAVLLLFGYKYDLFSAENKEGRKPIQSTFSQQIAKCIKIMQRNYKSAKAATATAISGSATRPSAQKQNSGGTKTAIGKDPRHILLSLDGGGIRGLVLVRILMHVERKLGTKLWDLVDWAAGTSTGGVLALALAKGNSLEDCQKLYLRMKNEAFEGKPPYDHRVLEKLFTKALSMDFLASIKRPRLLITSARVDIAPPKLKLFRNYPPTPYDSMTEMLDRGLSDDPTKLYICAAPSYFPPYYEVYADGGIICNNPTQELLTEFHKHRKLARVKLKPACIISVGTGWPPLRSVTIHRPRYARWFYELCTLTRRWEYYRGLYNCLMEQITESNGRPVSHCRTFSDALGIPFFRFSPNLTREVNLDETNDAAILNMMWDAEVYLAKQEGEVKELVDVLNRHIRKFG